MCFLGVLNNSYLPTENQQVFSLNRLERPNLLGFEAPNLRAHTLNLNPKPTSLNPKP